ARSAAVDRADAAPEALARTANAGGAAHRDGRTARLGHARDGEKRWLAVHDVLSHPLPRVPEGAFAAAGGLDLLGPAALSPRGASDPGADRGDARRAAARRIRPNPCLGAGAR